MTQLQQMLIEKYAENGPASKEDSMILRSVGMVAREFGLEEEIIEYLRSHPDATLQELYAFAAPFFPELVMED